MHGRQMLSLETTAVLVSGSVGFDSEFQALRLFQHGISISWHVHFCFLAKIASLPFGDVESLKTSMLCIGLAQYVTPPWMWPGG